ncbi:hypothetical protein FIBSPDRAFT_1044303 [Athelia psychrophila]|uniref:Uncharacterized protein n=1 Tax=Athelia psychrophila TaxID=1759441 RepID=A0A166JRB0_9AGAM|nr:hypothetical protein FIBSPDRAFT_1044303 [Fibularhizoctonia sp. CBS 109695]
MEDIKKPAIQNRLSELVAASGSSSRLACLAAVFIITLDLSFFIWNENPSKECLSQALSVYKEATTNHQAVMKAVTEACRLKEGDSILTREKAFRVRMTEIVLAHRLSESYRAGTGRG